MTNGLFAINGVCFVLMSSWIPTNFTWLWESPLPDSAQNVGKKAYCQDFGSKEIPGSADENISVPNRCPPELPEVYMMTLPLMGTELAPFRPKNPDEKLLY